MHDGIIKARNLIKMPIIGHHNKTVAIFAYDEDLTPRLNLFDLFSLYERYYLSKQAIKQFLGYWKVDTSFQEMPTHAETLAIIALSLDSRHKEVAKLLKITPRTVSCHTFSLHQKLKKGIDLHTLLGKIRNANRNTCTVEDWLAH